MCFKLCSGSKYLTKYQGQLFIQNSRNYGNLIAIADGKSKRGTALFCILLKSRPIKISLIADLQRWICCPITISSIITSRRDIPGLYLLWSEFPTTAFLESCSQCCNSHCYALFFNLSCVLLQEMASRMWASSY